MEPWYEWVAVILSFAAMAYVMEGAALLIWLYG